MPMEKASFNWGAGCFMRSVDACTHMWTDKKAKRDRATIINGDGAICEDPGEVMFAFHDLTQACCIEPLRSVFVQNLNLLCYS